MDILIISQHFSPEIGAAPNRIHSFAEALSSRGHQVTVITEMPNYPKGKILPGYENKFLSIERTGNIKIIRVPVFINSRSSNLCRLFFYSSFLISAFITSLFTGRCDIIIGTTPPPTIPLLTLLIKLCKNCKMVIDIRDLWTASAVEVSKMNPLIAKLSFAIEYIPLLFTDAITAVSLKVANLVKGHNHHLSKLRSVVIRNFVDIDKFQQASPVKKYQSKFVLLYSGNMGLVKNLDIIIAAAKELQEFDDILFLMVGEGVQRKELESQAAGLGNIIFTGAIPFNKMPTILARANACITSLRGENIVNIGYPVKMIEYLGAGTPVIAAVGGESKKLLAQNNAAILVKPGDQKELVNAIKELYQDNTIQERLSQNGLNLAKNKFDKRKMMNKFSNLIEFIRK